jgi:rubrerythrin
MSIKNGRSESRLRWLGFLEKGSDRALGILRRRYIDERRQAARLSQHAEKMRYPQFSEALRRIAAEESQHADCIAEKIAALGGQVPSVSEVPREEKNSWRYLLEDLEEERRCVAELEEELLAVEAGYPDVGELLRHIAEQEWQHRNEIRAMLMRSDPQASLSA